MPPFSISNFVILLEEIKIFRYQCNIFFQNICMEDVSLRKNWKIWDFGCLNLLYLRQDWIQTWIKISEIYYYYSETSD